ncbi:putative immunity protein [Brachybacterium vulturis]|uniref:putative immunity protein n=1 Tax=Brachybacterium vulturis TaxID=2017484 RepID=UPI0037360DF8
MILPEVRDPRMVTIRRGGTLRDEHHQLLALWAADCAEHDLGAAAYALQAVREARGDDTLRAERDWQRDRLPAEIRELVLEDQRRRDAIC